MVRLQMELEGFRTGKAERAAVKMTVGNDSCSGNLHKRGQMLMQENWARGGKSKGT